MPFSKKPVAAATFGNSGFSSASSRPASRGGQKKTCGLESLPAKSYASRHPAPARLNLSNALALGQLRNPLEMLHKPQKYSLAAGRPVTAPAMEEYTRPASVMERKKPAAPSLHVRRVDLPAYLNTPSRRSLDDPPPTPEEKLTILKKVRDLEMLADACRRANKVREEGRAVFSLGVLEDNMMNYQKAIDHYTTFLKVCKECKDAQGCSLAYHCLAVDFQLQGSDEPENPAALRRALYFHSKHRDSSDSSGKFVAHLNMGICYGLLKEKESSTVNHQYALRYALETNSVEGQTLALGNLGFSTGMYDSDVDKQKTLVTKYMSLSNEKQAAPLEKLGTLATREGDYEAGKQYFQEALDIARDTNDRERERNARVYLGIAAGETKFADHINSILKNNSSSPALGNSLRDSTTNFGEYNA